MTCQEITNQVTDHFLDVPAYKQFKDLQTSEEYKGYWELCLKAIGDRDLLGHIIFCNDLFRTPPVKTFLLYFQNELVQLTGRPDAMLDTFVKRGIGAFWGMVFKSALGYTEQESLSVSMNKMFGVRTATCFMLPKEKVYLEG